jgi:acetyltransferase
LIAKFHETLSERTVFMRYLQAMNLSQRTGHERLSRLSFIDYDREIALLALWQNPETHTPEIMGIGRLSKQHGTKQAEFVLIVSDQFQHQGLGKELLLRLMQVARDEKLRSIFGFVLKDNNEMIQLVEKLGFSLSPTEREGVLRAQMEL